jgi:hypothetical protein
MTKEERALLIKLAQKVRYLLLYTGDNEQSRDVNALIAEVLKP